MNKKVFLLTLSMMFSGLTACGSNTTNTRNEPMLDKAVWVWSENENGYSAQVKIPYSPNDYEIIDAQVTKEIAKERTCLESGTDLYVAKATYYGVLLESKKEVFVPAKGHSFDEFYITETKHFEKCECGELKEGRSHTYGNEIIIENSDGWKNPGSAKKICNVCKYEKVYNLLDDDEYTRLKLEHLNSILDTVSTNIDLKEIYKYSTAISDVKEVFDLLSFDEINKLDNTRKTKLLSLLFDFEVKLDSRVENSYSLYEKVNSITPIGEITYGVKDSVYGDVCELRLNDDWEAYSNPNTSYDSPYPNVIINNPPKVTTDTKNMVFFIYSPEQDISINIKVFDFNISNIYRDYLFKDNIVLNKGWNTVEISGAALGSFLLRDYHKLRLDFITPVLRKTNANETWKISSIYAANESIGKLISKVEALPKLVNARAYDFFNARNLLNRYNQLPVICRKILDNDGRIEELFSNISKYVSLPYGDSYDIKINWNTSHTVTPSVDSGLFGPAFKIDVAFDVTNGSYQHSIGSIYKTSRQTMVLYTKDYEGDIGVEYQGLGEGTYSKFCEFKKVKLSNGSYAHYVTLEDYKKFDGLNLSNCESKLCVKLRGTVKASKSVYLSPILHVNIKSFDVDDALKMLPNTLPTTLSDNQKELLDSVKFLYEATEEKDLVADKEKLNAYFDKFISK